MNQSSPGDMERVAAPTGRWFPHQPALGRRAFLLQGGLGLGAMAWAVLNNERLGNSVAAATLPPHFVPRARQVIFLNMSGGPSQLDLFDYKPELVNYNGRSIPAQFIRGERFAQLEPPYTLLASPYKFAKHGQSGAEVSELLPHLAEVVDDLAIVRSMTTDSFNHDPANMLLNSGSVLPGRPSMGSWVSYGLGSECEDLPAFVVLVSGTGEPVGVHSWSSGFLPSRHQGVQFRSQADPVLFLNDPSWMSRDSRRRGLEALRRLDELELAQSGDREIETRIAAAEMAFRMQTSVPELVDLSGETDQTLRNYGAEPGRPSFASNCLLARRLIERGVRFIQLYHRGWDHHGVKETGGIDVELPERCRDVDQASAALLRDMKQRGLLDSTLVIWGGEFGRTPIRQKTKITVRLGRDHHRRAFTMLLAGGGIKGGQTYGSSDELGYAAAENPVHVHDLQATILHLLGLDHTRLTYSYQGRDFRLTDVGGKVVTGLLA